MTDDPPPVERQIPQRLPRAGQIPLVPIETSPQYISAEVPPTRQLWELPIARRDYRLAQQSEEGVRGLVWAVISVGALLVTLAIVYWWALR
jgi:hypothetical protein